MGRSIYCSKCTKEKEPGRDNESYCCRCKSDRKKELRALKRQEKGLAPFGSGRSIYCYECKAVKENRKVGYCNACHRKKDNEWRISTGKTKKHQTGLCPCGKNRAEYSKSYCCECIAKHSKKWRETHNLTPKQIARRNELQNIRYHKTHAPRKLKLDPVNEKRRAIYNDDSPEALANRVKHQVRSLTRSFIKTGKLVKGACEICNTTVHVEAHHDDYSKPMDIRWLCRKHHREFHMEHKLN